MCVTETGCCGSSLRSTCVVIAIYFLLVYLFELIHVIVYEQYWAHTAYAATCIIVSICLLMAAVMEIKYLIIPWFLGFIVTFIFLIMAINHEFTNISIYVKYVHAIFDEWIHGNTSEHGGLEASEIVKIGQKIIAALTSLIIFGVVKLVVDFVLLRYVISFYVKLGKSNINTLQAMVE